MFTEKSLIPSTSKTTITIKEVATKEQALTIAPLYQVYYKKMLISEHDFIKHWQHAKAHPGYHMLAAYNATNTQPQGFIDFCLIPSIYWAPCVARIESTFIAHQALEQPIAHALFEQAFKIMKKHNASKVIAVSCTKYEQEVRVLADHLDYDNNPTKTFFTTIFE